MATYQMILFQNAKFRFQWLQITEAAITTLIIAKLSLLDQWLEWEVLIWHNSNPGIISSVSMEVTLVWIKEWAQAEQASSMLITT